MRILCHEPLEPGPIQPLELVIGQRGGRKRTEQLNAQERSALAKHAAWSRWHPREAQAARERAQEITYLVQ